MPEAHGQEVWGWVADLNGAPLKSCSGTKVLDSATKGCSSPPILVKPPEGIGAKFGAKRKARRPNDRKQLTQAGREALARTSKPKETGLLWRDSVVWELVYRCGGTALCDVAPPHMCGAARDTVTCAVKLVYRATIAHVSQGVIHFRVTGVDGATEAPTGGSLHSKLTPWDPAKLASDRAAELPAKQSAAKRAAEDLLQTQAALITHFTLPIVW